MNVIFHTLAGGAVATILATTKQIEKKVVFRNCIIAFIAGILSHGLWDWAPHCYPIPSKADVLISLVLMSATVWQLKGQYRILFTTAFLGAVFPDLIDLSPAILAKQTGWCLPVFAHIFPWHRTRYSGSVYSGDCIVSNGVHLIFGSLIALTFWIKKKQLKRLF